MSEYIVCPHCYNPLSQSEYVKVMRCRDCKYVTADQSDHDFREPLWCSFHRMDVRLDSFCAWAKRREP